MNSKKSLPWFRAYTEMIDDEKLRLLAFEDRWHFTALLCLKGQGLLDEGGPLLMRKVCVKMGLDSRALEEVARRLAEVGLIDQDTLQPLAWSKRQMLSDSDPNAAERKKRQREREKNLAATTPAGVDQKVWEDFCAGRNVTETMINAITREAEKAGITLNNALITCCETGWKSFKAEWYINRTQPKTIKQTPAFNKNNGAAKAIFGDLEI